jgi:5-deoxy-glucuronate isomerase
VITPAGAAYRGATVALDLVAVAAGQSVDVGAGPSDEAVLVLLDGTCTLDGVAASRSSVFDERATAVWIPPGAKVAVRAERACEFALASSVDAELPVGSTTPVVVSPSEAVSHVRGEPGWQRAVHDIVADNVDAHCLIVGETCNEPGQWSSYPPHKHDGADGEPALEEVYYYRFDRPGAFGVQCLYDTGGEERAVFLRHGDVVGIPHGYHPVAAAPGYRLYYLWALAGRPRRLAMYEDPDHRWLHSG